jgi:hypothetical protein
MPAMWWRALAPSASAAQQDESVRDSTRRGEATGSPSVSDGEQRWSNFATCAITDTLAGTGLAPELGPGGQSSAQFAAGHHLQLPRLTGGPFRYQTYAADTLADIAYKLIGDHSRADADGVPQMCYIGVTIPQNPRVESTREICDALVRAANFIPKERLGSAQNSASARKPARNSGSWSRVVTRVSLVTFFICPTSRHEDSPVAGPASPRKMRLRRALARARCQASGARGEQWNRAETARSAAC